MQNETDDKKQINETGKQQKPSLGWIWVVAIVIIVAILLAVLQPKSETTNTNQPQETEKQTTNTQPETNLNTDPLRHRSAGVYDLTAPTTTMPNTMISLDWIVSNDKDTTISSTSVYYDTVSHKTDIFSIETQPSQTKYTNNTTNNERQTTVPAKFDAVINSPENGTLYMRAYAKINGKHYWSKEKSTIVKMK